MVPLKYFEESLEKQQLLMGWGATVEELQWPDLLGLYCGVLGIMYQSFRLLQHLKSVF